MRNPRRKFQATPVRRITYAPVTHSPGAGRKLINLLANELRLPVVGAKKGGKEGRDE